MLMPGLRCLNTLRNRLAHRLDAQFDESAIGPIREFMTIWNTAAGKPVPQGMGLIEEFALNASAWFHGDACSIARHVPENGLLAFFDWGKATTNHWLAAPENGNDHCFQTSRVLCCKPTGAYWMVLR